MSFPFVGNGHALSVAFPSVTQSHGTFQGFPLVSSGKNEKETKKTFVETVGATCWHVFPLYSYRFHVRGGRSNDTWGTCIMRGRGTMIVFIACVVCNSRSTSQPEQHPALALPSAKNGAGCVFVCAYAYFRLRVQPGVFLPATLSLHPCVHYDYCSVRATYRCILCAIHFCLFPPIIELPMPCSMFLCLYLPRVMSSCTRIPANFFPTRQSDANVPSRGPSGGEYRARQLAVQGVAAAATRRASAGGGRYGGRRGTDAHKRRPIFEVGIGRWTRTTVFVFGAIRFFMFCLVDH